jgi:hypothetical protein
MNLSYKELMPASFPANARVWIYQASRLLRMNEALQLEDMLEHFVASWQTHGAPVKGWGTLFFGQFIILMADESQDKVSGCSTDSSVHFIQSVEKQFQISLFDRQLLAFVIQDKIQLIPLSQVAHALQHGFIQADSIYFNNMVTDRNGLDNNWMIPVKDSWLANRFALV